MACSQNDRGARFNDHLKGLEEEFELLSDAASTNSSTPSNVYLQRLKGEFDIMAVELESFQKEREDYEAKIEAQAKELKDVQRNVVCEKCSEGTTSAPGNLDGPTTSGGVNMTGKTTTGHSRPSFMQKLLAISPTGRNRSIIFNDKVNKEIDVEMVHKIYYPNPYWPIRCLKFSHDGKYVAAGGGCQHTAYIYDVQTGKLTCTLRNWNSFKAKVKYLSSLCFSHDGRYLATASSSDFCIYIWEINTNKLWKTFAGHTNYIFSLDFSPNGRLLVSASADNSVRLWNNELEKILTDPMFCAQFTSAVFSPDGRYIAASHSRGMATIWEVRTFQLVGRVKTHVGWVNSVRFMPDGESLVSGGQDETLRFWDVRSLSVTDSWDRVAEPKLEFSGHEGLVSCLSVSPDGRLIASGSHDKSVRIWDTHNATEQCILAHDSHIDAVDFSPAGQYFASVGSGVPVMIWRYSYISPRAAGLDGSDLLPSAHP